MQHRVYSRHSSWKVKDNTIVHIKKNHVPHLKHCGKVYLIIVYGSQFYHLLSYESLLSQLKKYRGISFILLQNLTYLTKKYQHN